MDLNRRDFNRLSMAALGGMMAGATAGCGSGEPPQQQAKDPQPPATTPATPVAKGEVHACRGLNACKGQGASGENACAGQGTCATVEHHTCAGQNTCKGLGGCGEKAGQNECKGQGGCAVPMTHGNAWETARAAFEEKMNAAGKEFGKAPAPKS